MGFWETIRAIAALGFWYNIGHLVVITATVSISLLAYKRNPGNLNNRSFIFFNLSLALWTLSMYMSNFLFLSHDVLVLINRSTFTFAFLLAIAYFKFCLVFPEKNPTKPWYYRIAIVTSFVMAIVSIATDLVHKNLVVNASKTAVIAAYDGLLFRETVLIYALLSFGATYILFSKLKWLKKRKRVQLQYVLLGSLLFLIYVFSTDLIPAALNVKDFSVFGAFGSLFFVFFTGYAVIKYRLMDIRLVVIKSATYTILLSLIIGIYVLFVFYVKEFYTFGINKNLIFIITTYVAITGFQPLRKIIEKYADRLFAKGRYNFEDLLEKISNIMSKNVVIGSLVKNLLKILSSEMKVRKIAFALKGGYIEVGGFKFSEVDMEKILKKNYKKILVADELEEGDKSKQLMQKLGIEVLLFFTDEENTTKGFMALSEKASGDIFSAQDIKLLEIIKPQVTIAISNLEKQKEMINQIIEERRRIDQDAHDHIYNRLGALAKKAEAAALNPNDATETLNLLKTDLRKAVGDLQRIVQGDTNTDEPEFYVLDELKKICDDFKKQSSIKLRCSYDESFVEKLEPKHFWHFQCILEECLNNIQKHSKATQASVLITSNNGSVALKVEDNGIGLKTNGNGTGKGLKGMKERAKKIGADISFSSNGKGTRVQLKIKNE